VEESLQRNLRMVAGAQAQVDDFYARLWAMGGASPN
jgi:hypothetical protein